MTTKYSLCREMMNRYIALHYFRAPTTVTTHITRHSTIFKGVCISSSISLKFRPSIRSPCQLTNVTNERMDSTISLSCSDDLRASLYSIKPRIAFAVQPNLALTPGQIRASLLAPRGNEPKAASGCQKSQTFTATP